MSPKHKQLQEVKKISKAPQKRRPEVKQNQETRIQQEPADLLLQRAALAPNSLTPADMAQLQSTIGNQALGRLGARRPIIQPKLTLGPDGDTYEQEADRVAKQVVGTLSSSNQQPTQRRKKEEDVQMKPSVSLQRQPREEPIAQMKSQLPAEGHLLNDAHDYSCCCPTCHPVAQQAPPSPVVQTERDGKPTQTEYKDPSQQQLYLIHNSVIQRNCSPGHTASQNAVKHVDGKGLHSEQLSGWGTHFVPGHSGRNFSTATRSAVDKIGYTHGCHVCGSKNPGTTSGHFVPDHQPPNSAYTHGYTGSVRFYAHCLPCSNQQAGVYSSYTSQMKNQLGPSWGNQINQNWFWN